MQAATISAFIISTKRRRERLAFKLETHACNIKILIARLKIRVTLVAALGGSVSCELNQGRRFRLTIDRNRMSSLPLLSSRHATSKTQPRQQGLGRSAPRLIEAAK
jgi:hypothetical protein